MAYQSLYRKYRPQTFADVMGQGHVVRTLQNALASGRVAHGYLFTGTRGTAKTTIARLLAKALNCESQPHPVTEPCNKCAACRSITAGNSIDVIEMDAASHRGVADIEEVRKSVGYGPMELRYKVFIIDEAHQLSNDAKDAFLKTLEEPPDNVVFILATTEPQAIPITIRSRCQQFDFKRGSLSEITARLRYVLDQEGVTYTPEAVNLIARGAEGSYRDSLSLLEQVLAFAPKHVTASEVVTVLGTLDTDALTRVTEVVAQRDPAGAFALAGQILDSGKEARTLLRTLAAHFRDLLLVKVGGPAVAAELTPEEVASLQRQAQAFAPQQMLRAVEILNEAQGETRWNNQHRLLVELTFLKLMTIGDAPEAPLPVAPIVFTAGPSTDLMANPITLPEYHPVEFASPASGNGHTSVAPEPPPIVSMVPPTETPSISESAPEENLAPSYFADDAADEDEIDPDEPLPVETVIPVAASVPSVPEGRVPSAAMDDGLFDPVDDEAPPEPVDMGPGLFDDEPEFASPVALATVPESPVTAVTADDSVKAVDTMLSSEAPSSGFGLFDEEEVGAGTPAPDPFRSGAKAEEEVAPPPWISSPTTPPDEEDEEIPLSIGPPPVAVSTWEESAPVADAAQETAPTPSAEQSVAQIEEEPDLFSIEDVYRAWPRFLMDARRLSKKTEIMMAAAHPERVYGSTLEIVFPGRFQYDMMNTPKALEFVRKLFARCLGAPKLSIKFVLSANAPPPPKRVETEKKQEFDPLAAIDALDSEAGSFPSAAAFPMPEYRPPVSPPPPSHFATAPRRQETAAPAAKFDPVGGYTAFRDDIPNDNANADHPALANPLVQDILEIFGGEIVSD